MLYRADKTLTLKMYVYMRASGASELRKFSHFHILKVLFPSIFCWYFRYFVSETYLISGVNNICIHQCSFPVLYLWYGAIINGSIPTKHLYWGNVCVCERASLENFGIFTFLNCHLFQYFVGTSDTLSVQMACLSAYMYRQISKYTDKFPNVPTKVWKGIIGGGGGIAPPCPPPPPPPLATLMYMYACDQWLNFLSVTDMAVSLIFYSLFRLRLSWSHIWMVNRPCYVIVIHSLIFNWFISNNEVK